MTGEARSVEVRLDRLEAQHRSLDTEVHGLARVCADIKNIALTNQHDIAAVKSDVAGLSACVKALADATYAGFKRTDEKIEQLETRFDKLETRFDKLETRFDQLELLIRQSLPSN